MKLYQAVSDVDTFGSGIVAQLAAVTIQKVARTDLALNAGHALSLKSCIPVSD
jgi:hypothetical protein